MGGLEDAVDHMEVSSLKLLRHFVDQLRPLLREVVFADDLDCVTELLLNGDRRLEHHWNDHPLYGLTVSLMNPVRLVWNFHRPAPITFDVVLKRNRTSYADVHIDLILIDQHQQQLREVPIVVYFFQELFRCELQNAIFEFHILRNLIFLNLPGRRTLTSGFKVFTRC